MAEITVKVAQVLRDNGIQCQYNESLNALQYALARNYLDEWVGVEVEFDSGVFDYWEAAHRRVGITRPHRK